MSYQKLELELASNPHHLEQVEQETLTQKIKNDKKRFEKMVTTQNQIQKIKAELDVIIQSMNNNPSYFSRAAIFWNDIPLWQKIIAGAVLTVPLLMMGILVNLGSLIMLSVVAVLVYTGSSILLDNHQRQNTDHIEHLKAGVSSLVDLLDTVISTLECLGEQLAIEIDAFQNENARLTANIGQFCEQINTLKSEIVALTDAEKALRATQVHLEHTATTLKGANDAQSQVLAQTQKQLAQVIHDYKDNQNLLSDKIQELHDTNEHLRREVEQSRAVALVFKGTVETFSNLAIQDKEQQAAFQKRLDEFLTNKEKSFMEVADRICDAEYKLSAMALELEECNQRYYALLDKQEQQIIRLEHIDVVQPEAAQKSFCGVKPSVNGFYAIKVERPFLVESTHGAEMIAVV